MLEQSDNANLLGSRHMLASLKVEPKHRLQWEMRTLSSDHQIDENILCFPLYPRRARPADSLHFISSHPLSLNVGHFLRALHRNGGEKNGKRRPTDRRTGWDDRNPPYPLCQVTLTANVFSSRTKPNLMISSCLDVCQRFLSRAPSKKQLSGLKYLFSFATSFLLCLHLSFWIVLWCSLWVKPPSLELRFLSSQRKPSLLSILRDASSILPHHKFASLPIFGSHRPVYVLHPSVSRVEHPADEEDLEIRILLICSPWHSDIRIHSDEQIQSKILWSAGKKFLILVLGKHADVLDAYNSKFILCSTCG